MRVCMHTHPGTKKISAARHILTPLLIFGPLNLALSLVTFEYHDIIALFAERALGKTLMFIARCSLSACRALAYCLDGVLQDDVSS